MAPSVIVFIDYQNVHKSGHETYCPAGDEIYRCLLDPLELALGIVAQRAPGGTLKEVRVYRGMPDSRKEPRVRAASDKHFSAWVKDSRVLVKRRPLQYPHDFGEPDCFERPREKGIDVSIAIDMVRLAFEQQYDVGILVSRDSDLAPPLEMIRDLKLAHVETAGWAETTRIGVGRVYHHYLPETLFHSARDTRTYIV